jgi:stage II sporulation protein AA (anti-sigma F factor antagonist)
LTAEKDTGRRLWRLHTNTTDEQGTPVLFLTGRIGHAEAAEFEYAALRHAAGPGDVVMDLSGVDYLSSAGLRILEFVAERQAERGGRLRLRAPSVAARLALDFSGLAGLIDG